MFLGNPRHFSPATAAVSPPLSPSNRFSELLLRRTPGPPAECSLFPSEAVSAYVRASFSIATFSSKLPPRAKTRIMNTYTVEARNSFRIRTYETLDLNSPGMCTYKKVVGGYPFAGPAHRPLLPISPLDLYSCNHLHPNSHEMILLHKKVGGGVLHSKFYCQTLSTSIIARQP